MTGTCVRIRRGDIREELRQRQRSDGSAVVSGVVSAVASRSDHRLRAETAAQRRKVATRSQPDKGVHTKRKERRGRGPVAERLGPRRCRASGDLRLSGADGLMLDPEREEWR